MTWSGGANRSPRWDFERSLYSSVHAEQASKLVAARWAAAQMPEWAPLIAEALRVRAAVARGESAEVDLPSVARFVNASLDKLERPA